MHPHHVHISYASPRVKSRGASSEEKKEEVREKDNEQHRTAHHQLGDDGKEALAEKKADYRTGYSEEKKQEIREENADQHRTARTGYSEPKKQDVREKDAEQHRTAYASLLAEKAEAEAKRREEQEAKRLEKREGIKKPLQLLNDEWFDLEPADGYPLPSPAQHFSQRQPVTARILLQWLPTLPCLPLQPLHRGYQRSSK
jgi:DNA primase